MAPHTRKTTPVVLMTSGSWSDEIGQGLERLGAHVVLALDQDSAVEAYPQATHVLIPGGSDISPDLYGEENHLARALSPTRDLIEFDLVKQALADAKPLLGICRGHQMICVAAGGTLHQDIAANTGKAHRSTDHLVYTHRGTRLQKILGHTAIVNSYHHQAVKRLPRGWKVAAVSADNLVEAIEAPDLPVLSVQWHPEVLRAKDSAKFFRAFLNLSS